MFLVLMKPLNSLTSQRRYTPVLRAPCSRIRRSSRFLQPHSGLVHWPLSPSANLCYPWSVSSNSWSLMDLVSAGTGCVGLRCPSHPLARKLISTVISYTIFWPSRRPIFLLLPRVRTCLAMSPQPQLNMFTTIWEIIQFTFLMEGKRMSCRWSALRVYSGLDCTVGIESTVMKVETANNKVFLIIFSIFWKCRLFSSAVEE